jgi:two-component system, response regulator YesN
MGNNIFKAIVVDDEQITRRGLIDYIQWDKYDIEIVGEASDGLEGLNLVEKVKPDLMICDIRMPKMDGIALAKKVKEILPECKIIFLSAYSDVQYLKSAIQLKAIDYVEKPVNLNEFMELIRKTVFLCKEEREKKCREKNLMIKVEQTIPYLRRNLLINLVGQEAGSIAIKADAELSGIELPAEGRYVCCVLNTPDKEMLEKILQKSMEAFEAAKVQLIAGEIRQQLVFVCPIQANMAIGRISSICQGIIESVKSEFQTSAAVGISSLCDSIYNIGEIYKQALEAVSYYFFKGIDNVILYSDIKFLSKHKFILDKHKLLRMEKCFMEQDFQGALKILDSMIKEMKDGDIGSIDSIKQELFKVYLSMSKIYSNLVLEFDNSKLWAKIFATGDIFFIRNFISNNLVTIQESIKSTRDNKNNYVIREVEAFIQENYSKNISIADIAKAVCLTPTYLCALFKKDKDETINDYITKIRIQNAMWLLKDQKLKLYEIALKVGYDDSNYFAKVFKKITGYNPSEYRDMI